MRRVASTLALLLLALALAGCGGTGGNDDGSGGDDDDPGEQPVTQPVYGRARDWTYTLEQSPKNTRVWTTPNTVKVFPEDARSPAPSNEDDEIRLWLAGGEAEAFQLVLWSATAGEARIAFPAFGIGESLSLAQVVCVPVAGEQWPDLLDPVAEGGTIALPAGRNVAVWITVRAPENATPGDVSDDLLLTLGGETVHLPVRLHVFDFSLPRPRSLGSLVDWSPAALGVTDSAGIAGVTALLRAERLCPSVPSLPASLPDLRGISYDPATASFDDTVDAPDSLADLGPTTLGATQFGQFLALRPTASGAPRPDPFFGVALGEPFGTAEYNLRWQAMLTALESYLRERGWLDKALWQVSTEPTTAEDLDLAAFLSETARAVAPDLALAIPSAPREELTDHPLYRAASFDLWAPRLSDYEPEAEAIRTRQAEEGERVYWRLEPDESDALPRPFAIARQGLTSRLMGFRAHDRRIDGLWLPHTTELPAEPLAGPGEGLGEGYLLYPAARESVRLALLREALEDYEYLVSASGGRPPAEGDSIVDPTVRSAVVGLGTGTEDDEAYAALRVELGRYVAGERDTLPLLEDSSSVARPRAEYHLNFQNPKGEPLDAPLIVDGATWAKIGWDAYSEETGTGWRDIAGVTTLKTAWLPQQAFDVLRRSVLWDESGTERVYEFALANGTYRVRASCGWAGRRLVYRHHRLLAEGVPLIEPGLPELSGYLEGEAVVTLADESLTVRVGGALDGEQLEPTILNWVEILPE